MDSFNILSWNVRGLKSKARRDVVRSLVSDANASVVFLQETKLSSVSPNLISEICGTAFSSYSFLPAYGTRGGVIVACRSPFTATVVQVLQFSINVTVAAPTIEPFHLSAVYVPPDVRFKEPFLAELVNARALLPGPWLLIGDFNLISSTADKNNANINRRSLASFRCFISDQELKDLHLFGRSFTWSNERASPTRQTG